MRDDVIDELRRENPVPDPLPAPPITPLLAQLDAPQHAHRGSAPDRESSRRRPRRRATPRLGQISFGGFVITIACVSATAIAVGALAILGHRRTERTAPAAHTPTSRQAGLTAASSIDAVLVAYLFPHDGVDWALGQPLRVFISAVDIKAETRCLAADHLPGPPIDPVIDNRFGSADMPNLPLITRTLSLGATTRYPGPTNPARHLSGRALTRYHAAVTRCAATAQHAYPFTAGPTPVTLQEQWFKIIERIEHSSAVRAANRQSSQCSQSTPFPASGVEAEIGAIEAKLTRPNIAGQYGEVKAIQARGARVLIKCFRADITLQSRLTATARAHFLATHAQAVRQIEGQADHEIPVLEARYHVRLTPTGPSTH